MAASWRASFRNGGSDEAELASQHVEFTINGTVARVAVETTWSLVEVLRQQLNLTGTKLGCGVGVCGACSVIVDGALQSACLVPAVQLDGRTVETIEGMAKADGSLSELQESFVIHGGFQCGICTAGQIVAATALLRSCPEPTRKEIADWMKGNLCRCTGYYGIIRAIQAVAGRPA